MKLLNDFTDAELVQLTDEDKNVLYLLELAEKGIPLPTAIPQYIKSPAENDEYNADVMVYLVGGHYFATMEQAQAIADLANSFHPLYVDYDWRNSDRTYHIGDRNVEVTIETKQVYSKDKYAELKDEIALYEKKKSNIEANNKRREEIISHQSDIMTQINDRIYEAQKNTSRLAELNQIFEQYKLMADNDHTIAVRFLLNAHYGEVVDYQDNQLEKIGLTRSDIDAFNNASKLEEGEI